MVLKPVKRRKKFTGCGGKKTFCLGEVCTISSFLVFPFGRKLEQLILKLSSGCTFKTFQSAQFGKNISPDVFFLAVVDQCCPNWRGGDELRQQLASAAFLPSPTRTRPTLPIRPNCFLFSFPISFLPTPSHLC